MTSIKTPIEMLEHWEAKFPDQIYLRQSTGSDWIDYSWKSVADQVRKLATYIMSKNYPSGSRIAIWSTNSTDWVITDLAIMLSGHISVPIYPAQDVDTARYILNHSKPVMMIAGQFTQADNINKIISDEIDTIAIHGATISCDISLAEIVANITPLDSFAKNDLDDVLTIIYSSGTSGPPKGVMLTFRALSQTQSILTNGYGRVVCEEPGDERERVISYLPMSHGAERSLVVIASLYLNSQVSVSAGLENFTSEIHNVRPTFFGAVPRIWYKFMQGIEANLKSNGASIETEEDKQKVRYMLGLDKVKSVVTGSAPVSPSVHEWYANIGLHLRESYGMTETFAYGTLWSSNNPPLPACVGKPLDGVELKLDEMDEIHLKSPVMMTGYYKNPEKTAETLNDGWYATGDLGSLDDDGNLWLTGRAESVFKTSKGKFINPEPLEQKLLKELPIDHICVLGHGMAQPVVVANVSEIREQYSEEELIFKFQSILEGLNNQLPAYEKISSILLVSQPWGIESGELTPTLKIKRRVIDTNYKALLESCTQPVIIEN